MGRNSQGSSPTLTQSRNEGMSDDPRDQHRLNEPEAAASTPIETRKPHRDEQNQATVEEFGREGLGVAAKE